MDFVYSHEKRVLNIATPREKCVWLYKRTQSKRRIENRIRFGLLETFEEVSTLLRQIKACGNSRPLCAISSVPNDLMPLTPGHFLIGQPLFKRNAKGIILIMIHAWI